jgi:hypothetical protein|tara:strand:- start:133 stop:459 length:327 start_codon:yes stop_codon:yes gene_type:complete
MRTLYNLLNTDGLFNTLFNKPDEIIGVDLLFGGSHEEVPTHEDPDHAEDGDKEGDEEDQVEEGSPFSEHKSADEHDQNYGTFLIPPCLSSYSSKRTTRTSVTGSICII